MAPTCARMHGAGDVTDQMRALTKRHSPEGQALTLHELLQDVFALVHSDAVEGHVSLDCAAV
jgi:hypothetical protein